MVLAIESEEQTESRKLMALTYHARDGRSVNSKCIYRELEVFSSS